MMKYIDDFLNSITMYRLVLYYLIVLLIAALILSTFGLLSFSPLSLLASTIFILIVGWVTNTIFAKVFNAVTNIESVYISAFILTLIITPAKSLDQLPFIFWATIWTMASKYIFAINKKHIFNPAAFGVALTALAVTGSASWWVGTLWMLPFTLAGVLIVRKIRRLDLVFYFFVTALITILGLSFLKGVNPFTTLQKTFVDSPILFLAFVMLTEPLTTPPTKTLQSVYGAIVGVLFSPQLHIGPFFTTPETALLLGNIYSYIVSPKIRLMLTLQEKIKLSPDVYDFVFNLNQKIVFTAGQYLEWTLPHKSSDDRGNRRYFTIASAPTENNLRIGVKFYPNSSSFKKALIEMKPGDQMGASQLMGDFTLPADPNKKLVFIAGGIGVTPFRSIVKYLLDTNQEREIVLMYSNKTEADVVYRDLFDQATKQLGIKVCYVIADKVGFINEQMIKTEVPDFKERMFYLSGPHTMVTAFEGILTGMQIQSDHIKTDYFPGFA